jgi:hypothetical protein
MSIILLIRRTFMSLPPEGRINPGRDHGAEKSVENDIMDGSPTPC